MRPRNSCRPGRTKVLSTVSLSPTCSERRVRHLASAEKMPLATSDRARDLRSRMVGGKTLSEREEGQLDVLRSAIRGEVVLPADTLAESLGDRQPPRSRRSSRNEGGVPNRKRLYVCGRGKCCGVRARASRGAAVDGDSSYDHPPPKTGQPDGAVPDEPS